MFALNEKVVYPGHGVARVSQIMERSIGGKTTILYELKFLNRDMTILVPIDNLTTVGVRSLSSRNGLEKIFQVFMQQYVCDANSEYVTSWNKRHKKYQSLVRTGSLVEIAKIYRDLQYLSFAKELSFGEKNLLQQTETLLAEEIATVCNSALANELERMRSFFVPPTKLNKNGQQPTR